MIYKRITQSISILTSLFILVGCADSNSEDNNSADIDETVEETQNENPDGPAESIEEDNDFSDDEVSEESHEDEIEESISIDYQENLLDPSSIKALVNKQYDLPEDYEPEDLVTVDVPTVLDNPEIRQLRESAADSLKEMFDAAEEEGIYLHARSGYRSYQTQVQLYNSYVSNHGEEAADRYSARPGHSEHQTGLGMDITSESVNYQLTEAFGDTIEGLWVKDNAHRFGYIIRYPEGKEEITGYQFEPWHLRYLGEELATEVYESNLTYEEYLIERGIAIEINE